MITMPSGQSCPSVMYDPSPNPASFGMRLCNFPTGSTQLLPEHYQAINDKLLGAMWPYQNSWIDLVGYASKLQYASDPSGNTTLSRNRCLAVQNYLDRFLSTMQQKFRFNWVQGRSDWESQQDSNIDHGFHRAVEIRLFSQGQYRWTRPPVLRHGYTLAASDQFEFQAIESASPTLVLFEADAMIFSIHDLLNHRLRYYSYWGVGATVPIPKTPAVGASAEHKSRPVPFTTAIKIVDMEDFAGSGSIDGDPGFTMNRTSVGGSVTLTMNTKAYEDRHISTPLSVKFSFSRGFGASIANVGTGRIKILDQSFRPTVYPD